MNGGKGLPVTQQIIIFNDQRSLWPVCAPPLPLSWTVSELIYQQPTASNKSQDTGKEESGSPLLLIKTLHSHCWSFSHPPADGCPCSLVDSLAVSKKNNSCSIMKGECLKVWTSSSLKCLHLVVIWWLLLYNFRSLHKGNHLMSECCD